MTFEGCCAGDRNALRSHQAAGPAALSGFAQEALFGLGALVNAVTIDACP